MNVETQRAAFSVFALQATGCSPTTETARVRLMLVIGHCFGLQRKQCGGALLLRPSSVPLSGNKVVKLALFCMLQTIVFTGFINTNM